MNRRNFIVAVGRRGGRLAVRRAGSNLSGAAGDHGGALCGGGHVRRHGPHHVRADGRTPGPVGNHREYHRRRRHHRGEPCPRRPTAIRCGWHHAYNTRRSLQEAALRRDQGFHAGGVVLRAADGARSTQGPCRQHVSGIRRAPEGEWRKDAVRLGRGRLDDASRLFVAQRKDRRQRHARAVSRFGAGRERSDRRADRLPVRQPWRGGAADHRQGGEAHWRCFARAGDDARAHECASRGSPNSDVTTDPFFLPGAPKEDVDKPTRSRMRRWKPHCQEEDRRSAFRA